MIGLLRGRVADRQPNTLIVDVQGVGYEVHVPLSTFYDVGEIGDDITLRIYTHVREDALQLYGFLTELERQLFERLIGISGIGPKLAIAVLSWNSGTALPALPSGRRWMPVRPMVPTACAATSSPPFRTSAIIGLRLRRRSIPASRPCPIPRSSRR
jgi:hypothetical protein